MREKFGVPPDKVVDVQALAGDSTDNVPGVPGIGVKTAAELINEYGDLDTLLARAGEIKQPKRRERLIEFADAGAPLARAGHAQGRRAGRGAGRQLGVRDPEADALLGFLREMEFSTLTKRIAEGLRSTCRRRSTGLRPRQPRRPRTAERAGRRRQGRRQAGCAAAERDAAGRRRDSGSATQEQKIDRSKYETVTELPQLEAWIAEAQPPAASPSTPETTSLDPMQAEFVGFSLAVAPGKACYVPLGHRAASGSFDFGDGDRSKQIAGCARRWTHLKPLLEDPSILKIGQNLKFDCLVLAQHGIDLAPLDDTMLLSYALDAGRGQHGMDALAERHLGHTCMSFAQVLEHAPGAKKSDKTFAQVPLDKATEYAAEDADVTLRLWMVLKPRLAAERMTTVYETLERPLVPRPRRHGARRHPVDQAILSRLTSTFAQRIARLEEEIYELAGHKFNLGSPKQLGEFLFDSLKLPGGRKTKTGQWETRADLLDDLAAREDLPEDARKLINVMLEWRQLTKLQLDLHGLAARTTSTRRRGASTPPTRSPPPRPGASPPPTPTCRTFRSAPRRAARSARPSSPSAGHKLISADYSQIELRVLAHVADIPQLSKAFEDGLDIHAMTASEMFGVPSRACRPRCAGAPRPSTSASSTASPRSGSPPSSASPSRRPASTSRPTSSAFPASATTWRRPSRPRTSTATSRRSSAGACTIPEINTKNPSMRGFLERAAINAPIQGSAADIIRRAMIRMPRRLQDAGSARVRMLLQVHDELVFEAKEADVDKALEDHRQRDGESRRAGRAPESAGACRRQSRRQLGSGALADRASDRLAACWHRVKSNKWRSAVEMLKKHRSGTRGRPLR